MGKKISIFLVFLFSYFLSANAQDRSLDFYITYGLHNNPLLIDLNNRLLSTGIDSMILRAQLKPSLYLTSNVMYAPASNDFGYDSAITNGGNYSALINISQPLLSGKKNKALIQNNTFSIQGLQTDINISSNELTKNITEQFLIAYSDFSQLISQRSILKLLKEQAEIMKSLTEKGLYQQTDLLNFKLTVRNQEITILQMQMQFKNDLGILNLTCGIMDTSSVTLVEPDLQLKNDFNIENSQRINQFRIDSLKNNSTKSLIDMDYRPTLNAFADAGFNSINPKNISNNFGTSIGLNFSLPIYNGKQRKFQYSKIALAEKTRMTSRDFFVTQYELQKNHLLEQLKFNEDLISGLRLQVEDQKKLIDLYRLEMNHGLVRFIDYLSLINNYSQAEINLNKTEAYRLQIINQLNHLK